MLSNENSLTGVVRQSFSTGRRGRFGPAARALAAGLLLALLLTACGAFQRRPYIEDFQSPGKWGAGTTPEVSGRVVAGTYEMMVKADAGLFLATADEVFGDATYEVEATQLDGPLNNGYGMLFRVDTSSDSFYAFEVSGDGFVWIGRCSNLCEDESLTLVSDDWFRSPAVRQGLQETNRLLVVAEGSLMTFFVNGVEVGRASDSWLAEGDIAVMVETLGEPDVRVAFDNFKVTTPETR